MTHAAKEAVRILTVGDAGALEVLLADEWGSQRNSAREPGIFMEVRNSLDSSGYKWGQCECKSVDFQVSLGSLIPRWGQKHQPNTCQD